MTDETLFLEYVEAVDRGENPDISQLCLRAKDPISFRKNIELHSSLGNNIGRFKVLEQLGKGGFGTVFLAQDPELGRQVAIKMMSGQDWARNEARSLARLRHPNIVEVFEVEDDYIVMEYVKGKSLTPEGTMQQRLQTLLKIASAVAYAHEEGVLSRDIKPDNVIQMEDGDVKLIDFSIAHVEGDDTDLDITSNLVATPAYLAPEQIESESTGASPASDQFSLGILAYEYLSGEHPFRTAESTRRQVLDAVARCAPKRPAGLSRDLQNIVLKMLDVDPARRYASVAAARDDLLAVMELRPVSVSGANPMRILRRYRTQLIFAGALVLSAIGALVLQSMMQLSAMRAMPIEYPTQVARLVAMLGDRPDTVTEERILERLGEVSVSDSWAFAAWSFRQVTGRKAPIDHGRVYIPAGATIERQLGGQNFEPVEIIDDVPLGPGYYRCQGQYFRKVRTWDPAIHIEERERDTTGARDFNGILATEPILGEDGKILVNNLDGAMEYARQRGGRLPFVSELVQMGIDEGPTAGEWIANYFPLTSKLEEGADPELLIDQDPYYVYGGLEEYLEIGLTDPVYLVGVAFLRDKDTMEAEDGSNYPKACFRIVFPTEE